MDDTGHKRGVPSLPNKRSKINRNVFVDAVDKSLPTENLMV